ncbi:hypothetical protein [Acinetobacter baumannii]|uniref:hypothetical protein n=1 Tax=Acinetobacter baumannii TaxID=470 RepID=UPI0018AFB873|nr:hypothetical protein [Acinetobacter baumannii]MBF9225242.1 hypothetical protein [Acinetobacter baumannii]MCJ9136999.1 hypothetical protein [Acinetobacter baumannii]MCJ9279870.1 hypothetical protein [Acinetobacter baumannii]MCJ9451977.1 hypothetical protein [Acinetobacter baumannii]MCJ9484506.1 hypothetical protein [Acinetobacter baumannii]
MKIYKISKPFAGRVDIASGSGTVSYSKRALKIAVGNTAIDVTKDELQEILNQPLTERCRLFVDLFNKKMED